LHISTFGLLPSANIDQLTSCSLFSEIWSLNLTAINAVNEESTLITLYDNEVIALMI